MEGTELGGSLLPVALQVDGMCGRETDWQDMTVLTRPHDGPSRDSPRMGPHKMEQTGWMLD